MRVFATLKTNVKLLYLSQIAVWIFNSLKNI